jgi:hypothetical protein
MTFTKLHKTLAFVAALALTTIGLATTAQATAIYEAEATGLLTITDIVGGDSNTVIEGDAFIIGDFIDVTGNASASTDGHALVDGASTFFPVPLTTGSTIDLWSYSYGEAHPVGYAESLFWTSSDVYIDNFGSSADVTVSFSFDYSLSAFTSATDPSLELAKAFASVDVFSPFSGTFYLSEIIESATDLGGGLVTYSDTIPFNVTVPTGGYDDFVISFVNTDGYADSPIPEPSTIILFGIPILGLFGYGWLRRKKQRT